MAPRALDVEMTVNLHDVVEIIFFEMSAWVEVSLADRIKKVVAQFETSSADQVKDKMRKALCRCLWR